MRGRTNAEPTSVERTYQELLSQGFPAKHVLALEAARYLEDVLWPDLDSTKAQSWSLLAVWIFNAKSELSKRSMRTFVLDGLVVDTRLSIVLHNALQSILDEKLNFSIRIACTTFFISALGNLDILEIQKFFQPLVSIGCWRYMLPNRREELFEEVPLLKKRYKSKMRALTGNKELESGHINDFVYRLSLELFALLNTRRNDHETVRYCCKVIDLFILILSQLPTRRYTIFLLKDLQLSVAIRLSHRFMADKNDTSGLKLAVRRLEERLFLPFDDLRGRESSANEARAKLTKETSHLQRLAFTDFKESLMLLALSNHDTINIRTELRNHLQDMDSQELQKLCRKLNIRTSYESPNLPLIDKKFMLEALLDKYQKPFDIVHQMGSMSLYPTEVTLFSSAVGQPEDRVPSLNLQYLSVSDFLYQSLELSRGVLFRSIRSEIAASLLRLGPEIVYPIREIRYNGTSKHAISIESPSILEVLPPKIGSPGHPALVRAEVKLDLGALGSDERSGWRHLVEGDLVFFIALVASDATSSGLPATDDPDFAGKMGISCIRSAKVDSLLCSDGKPLSRQKQKGLYDSERGDKLLLRVVFDPIAFQKDKEENKLERVYEHFNIMVKRKERSNKSLSALEAFHTAACRQSNVVPEWFQDPFLGLGVATRSTDDLQISLRDTLVDVDHAAKTFPGINITLCKSTDIASGEARNFSTSTNQLKRTLADRGLVRSIRSYHFELVGVSQIGNSSDEQATVELAGRHWHALNCIDVPKNGAYSLEARKRNMFHFTPDQVKAICSATAPGLTLIDGAPGCGKSLITAQIINNLLHDEATKRTLVLCKTDRNVASLIGFLRTLDVSDAHFLVLRNSTEGEDASVRHIDDILRRRAFLLEETKRLCRVMGVAGDHGASCETAAYFYSTIVQPSVTLMLQALSAPTSETDSDSDQSLTAAFDDFFAGIDKSPYSSKLDLGKDFQIHLENLFAELAELRPLEILKSHVARQTYLLSTFAKVIITTAEYAAREQAELVKHNLSINTIIMEQASSISDIESFAPFTFIKHSAAIHRLVFLGDTQQIGASAIVGDRASNKINTSQSLFSRLIRTGNPTMKLLNQGRSRAALAGLYQHRYPGLSTLSSKNEGEYASANAGFEKVCQFVEVPNYQSQGEFSPRPNTFQNLGEAEYVVAVYQYMRLLNYPASDITIVTPFTGQKSLIQEILNARCRNVAIFGVPDVATVAEFQSSESKYVLLSLVRTIQDPHIEGVDECTVTTAISRAKLGLYVFGRRNVMVKSVNDCLPQHDTERGDKLVLVTGEMHPTSRLQDETSDRIAVMEGVEHLGKYVYEMTQKRLALSTTT